MSSREARHERRAAQRKAEKIARKSGLSSPTAAPQDTEARPSAFDRSEPKTQEKAQFVSQNTPEPSVAAKSEPKPGPTGPRTPEGKRTASRNALTHGLTGATLVISAEERSAFHALLQSLLEEHQPADRTEQLLVEQMAQSHWLSQRALRLQEQCFGEDGVDEKGLALFLRYYTTHDRAFHKALNTLIRLKKDRAQAERKFVSQNKQRPHFVSQKPPQDAPGVRENGPDLVPKSFSDLVDAADFDQIPWNGLETLPDAA